MEVLILNVVFFSNTVGSPERHQQPLFLRSYSLISRSLHSSSPLPVLWRSTLTTLFLIWKLSPFRAAYLSPGPPIRVVLYRSLSQSSVSHVLLRTAHLWVWMPMWNDLPLPLSIVPMLTSFRFFLFLSHLIFCFYFLFAICNLIKILFLCSPNQMCVCWKFPVLWPEPNVGI